MSFINEMNEITENFKRLDDMQTMAYDWAVSTILAQMSARDLTAKELAQKVGMPEDVLLQALLGKEIYYPLLAPRLFRIAYELDCAVKIELIPRLELVPKEKNDA